MIEIDDAKERCFLMMKLHEERMEQKIEDSIWISEM